MTPPLIETAHNRSEENESHPLSHFFPLSISVFVRVIHTLSHVFFLSFSGQERTRHANTAFKSNTNLADITNREPLSIPLSVRSLRPSADRDETEDTNCERRRGERARGTIPVGRGRRGRAMAVGLVGRSDGWVEQRVGSLLPLGKCL